VSEKDKKKSVYIYLTPLGRMIAEGELLIRKQEEKDKNKESKDD